MKKYLVATSMVFLILSSTSYAGEQLVPHPEDQVSQQMLTYRRGILSTCESFASILAEAGYVELATQCDKASTSPLKGSAYRDNLNKAKQAENNNSKKALLNEVAQEVFKSLLPLLDIDPKSPNLIIE